MLVALGGLVVSTGLPVWALLLGVSSVFAALASWLGAVPADYWGLLGGRLLGLLSDDLLQAIPLFVLVGMLLQKLPLAGALFDCFAWLASRLLPARVAPSIAALGMGTVVAPMNGSAASSAALLGRLLGARLPHLPAEGATALLGAAATIGVVVPPSLVLLLLGDAMMRAHLEASNLPGYALASQRIVSTQDILHAALLPSLSVVGVWMVIAAWLAWRSPAGERALARPPFLSPRLPRPSVRQGGLAAISLAVLICLLGGVFVGWLLPVEAAATGATLMLIGAWFTRALDRAQWRAVMADTLALSGALIALLVGATTFSLVFRAFGTDKWMAALLLGLPLSPLAAACLVLLIVGLCALLLDAFEMIVLIIPIVAPPLILFLGDVQQAAVLLLLVLQASFLVPPLGYALLMVQSTAGLPHVAGRGLARTMAPFIVTQMVVTAAVLAWPALVHQLGRPDELATSPEPGALDASELLRQMADQNLDVDDPADPTEPSTPQDKRP